MIMVIISGRWRSATTDDFSFHFKWHTRAKIIMYVVLREVFFFLQSQYHRKEVAILLLKSMSVKLHYLSL